MPSRKIAKLKYQSLQFNVGEGLLYILKEVWLWIIIFFLIMILVGPFVILYLLLLLPAPLRVGSTFLIIILWAVIGGYKDWVMDKRKRKTKGFNDQ